MKWLWLLMVLSGIHGELSAAVRAEYGFDGNPSDISGNGLHATVAGSGPSYVTSYPAPLQGTASAKAFTAANYLQIPLTTITAGMQTSGCWSFKFFIQHQAANTLFIGPEYASPSGRLLFYLNYVAGDLPTLKVPTAGGEASPTAGSAVKRGVWYSAILNWDSSGVALNLRENSGSTWTQAITWTGTPKVTGGTTFNFGQTAGYGWPISVDDFTIYDAPQSPASIDTTKTYRVANFGDSYTYGDGTPNDGNGPRNGMLSYWQSIGWNAYFTGQTVNGTIITPYTDAVNGSKSVDTLGIVTAKLAADFADTTSARHIAVFSTLSANDAANNVTMSSYTANVDAIINSVTAYNPLITQYWVLMKPITCVGGYANMPAYTSALEGRLQAAQAAGKNVKIIDQRTFTPFNCDGTTAHPSIQTYYDFGYAQGQAIYAGLQPTPTPASSYGPQLRWDMKLRFPFARAR